MAPLLLALPAYGYSDRGPGSDDGGGIFDFLLNSILTVFVLGFAAFIVKYAYDAYKIVESQSDVRAERLGWNKDRAPDEPVSNEPLYDNFDYTYKNLSEKVENSRTRKGQSKQVKADGTRFAPWMNIDEDKVAEMKANREKRLAKEKASTGKGEPPKKKNFWEL
jgi:hypothetical protein